METSCLKQYPSFGGYGWLLSGEEVSPPLRSQGEAQEALRRAPVGAFFCMGTITYPCEVTFLVYQKVDQGGFREIDLNKVNFTIPFSIQAFIYGLD